MNALKQKPETFYIFIENIFYQVKFKSRKKSTSVIYAILVISSTVTFEQLVPKHEIIMAENPSDSDSDASNFGEFDNKELFTHTDFFNTIGVGRIIAIYSNQTINKPFFLCKFLGKIFV